MFTPIVNQLNTLSLNELEAIRNEAKVIMEEKKKEQERSEAILAIQSQFVAMAASFDLTPQQILDFGKIPEKKPRRGRKPKAQQEETA